MGNHRFLLVLMAVALGLLVRTQIMTGLALPSPSPLSFTNDISEATAAIAKSSVPTAPTAIINPAPTTTKTTICAVSPYDEKEKKRINSQEKKVSTAKRKTLTRMAMITNSKAT